ncbi:MAG TPA: DUF4193 family protein [Candidatus Limnocylindrales bacterium]|nr:DUF4193 family protein [Candidatus Limnocylindrales bacterium]
MSTVDYDAPRTTAGTEPDADSLDMLRERRGALADPDFGEAQEFPGSDIDDEFSAPVIPIRTDEFRCHGCFLVLHNGLHAGSRNGHDVCRDCA